MIEHIVLFKVKAGSPPAAVADMVDGLAGLKNQIPGVVDLSIGANTSDRNQGFTHGLAVRFQDRAALVQYLPHPSHQEVVQKYVKPIVEAVIVVDYEI